MPIASYSPQETAAISGAPLVAIQKAITMRKIPAHVIGSTRRRQLDETALFAFALVETLPGELHLSPGAAYQLLRRMTTESRSDKLTIGGVVQIDLEKALAAARRRLALYERARQIIVSDPAIMGGAPTIRGTRITAQSILGRVESGESVEIVLEDYPYLDRDSVEAAALYARANPPRGRPSGKLWHRAS
jgi:uncharacterized protein (DUF433 family)